MVVKVVDAVQAGKDGAASIIKYLKFGLEFSRKGAKLVRRKK